MQSFSQPIFSTYENTHITTIYIHPSIWSNRESHIGVTGKKGYRARSQINRKNVLSFRSVCTHFPLPAYCASVCTFFLSIQSIEGEARKKKTLYKFNTFMHYSCSKHRYIYMLCIEHMLRYTKRSQLPFDRTPPCVLLHIMRNDHHANNTSFFHLAI